MQIGNTSPQNPRPGRPGDRRGIDLTRKNREGLQEAADRALEQMRQAAQADPAEAARQAAAAKEEAQAAEARAGSRTQDKIELSSGAERLASGELPGPRGAKETPEARAERVTELKEALKAGDLHSPERLARAAERLLMSDD